MTWLTKALGLDEVRHRVGAFFAHSLSGTRLDPKFYAKQV